MRVHMQLVDCSFEKHAVSVLEILNEAIANSTALYDYKARSIESMENWFSVKAKNKFPVIGCVDDDRTLLGFASYGTFRAWPAYKYTVEHSVYIHKDHRGKGIGLFLMRRLIEIAREQQYHSLIGGIDAKNVASVVLHEKLGFRLVGTLPQVGFKFGRWLDLAFYQLLLDTPFSPVDD
ncbi:MAG: N-acetyltransferase [Candidatus Brocadia sp. AMX2]|nr:MAG: N-acetyltransferase [Candidatus Brocadia sp. AMX2]MBC6933395.1 N-acetyltransferase [Candidatus Brocadia sp.]MBL1170251.1 N-acetyltransferase [Candidatus Brocadia sp. AMX1]NOG40025.1 N-acetyltransferase [Planctomycetota bacterium]MCE7867645.1 N-acetyltransferase [Candidatus Brocadia sp. AMX2]